MAKISVNILFGERVAATQFIEVEDRKILGATKEDIAEQLEKLAAGLEAAAKKRRKDA